MAQSLLGSKLPEEIATQHEFPGAPLIFWAEINTGGLLELGMKFYDGNTPTQTWSITLKPPASPDTPLAKILITENGDETTHLNFDGSTHTVNNQLPKDTDSADTAAGAECHTWPDVDYETFYNTYLDQVNIIFSAVSKLSSGNNDSWAGLFTHQTNSVLMNERICEE